MDVMGRFHWGTRTGRFENPTLDYEFTRALAYEAYDGAALGECLEAAAATRDADPESWAAAWNTAASRVEARADEAFTGGHLESARGAYRRAFNYRRVAAAASEPGSELQAARWRQASRAFARAAELSDPPLEPLQIPFEGHHLPGYFAGAPGRPGPNRTLVVVDGTAGSAEESFFIGGAAAALERGWNVVLFNGPGHRGARHLDPGLVFRPDYEHVVGAVLDHVLPRDDVDEERVALAGWSLGGQLAARAAALDPRVRALVLSPPLVDMRALTLAAVPRAFAPVAAVAPPPVGRVSHAALRRIDPPLAAYVDYMLWAFGVPSADALLKRTGDFRLGDLPARIRCPTRAHVGEAEGPEALEQARDFHDAVAGPKELRVFTRRDGADAHCQVNNLPLAHQEMLDWLDRAIG